METLYAERDEVGNVLACYAVAAEIECTTTFAWNPEGTQTIQFFREDDVLRDGKETVERVLAWLDLVKRGHGIWESDSSPFCDGCTHALQVGILGVGLFECFQE
jgi:hypothetical protein